MLSHNGLVKLDIVFNILSVFHAVFLTNAEYEI